MNCDQTYTGARTLEFAFWTKSILNHSSGLSGRLSLSLKGIGAVTAMLRKSISRWSLEWGFGVHPVTFGTPLVVSEQRWRLSSVGVVHCESEARAAARGPAGVDLELTLRAACTPNRARGRNWLCSG